MHRGAELSTATLRGFSMVPPIFKNFTEGREERKVKNPPSRSAGNSG
jgi:hypothetical protein